MQGGIQSLYDNLTANLLGTERISELLLIGLLAEGHVLIQGGPGMGKTSLAKVLAASLECRFTRIQFTPDLLPADILGYSLYDQKSGEFIFHKGPVFTHIVLADEINRASPRTQSALLESMNECQVSIDGVSYVLEKPFFVVATENHLTSTGTFPLPDSQLDRFMISFDMPSPGTDTQTDILSFHASNGKDVPAVMSREELVDLQASVRDVKASRNVLDYIVQLCEAVRGHKEIGSGISSRASIALMNASKAQAFLNGRDAVYPDDVKQVLIHVLRHRVMLKSGTGHARRADAILRDIVNRISVPVG